MLIARPDIEVYEEIIISDQNGPLEMRGADGELLDAPFEMRVQFGQAEIDQAFAEASRVSKSYAQRSHGKTRSSSYDPLREIGMALYHNLFEGRRRVLFERKVAEARERSEGVRLNFELTGRRCVNLPWEVLHDSNSFISLSSAVQVARRLPNATARNYEPLDRVKVLVMSLNRSGNALVEQIRMLRGDELDIVPTGAVRVEVISAENLPRRISTLNYDVLHVISGNERGRPQIPIDYLQRSIEAQQPRLIVLQTPNSDKAARQLAPRSGAVITVHGNVSEQAKVAFADGLYRSLFTEHVIDQAVAAARQEIDLQIPGSRDWGLPRYYRPPAARLPLLQVPDEPVQEARSLIQSAEAAPNETVAAPAETRAAPRRTLDNRQRRRLEIRLHMEELNLHSLEQQTYEYRSVPAQLQQQIEKTRRTISALRAQLQ